MFLRKRISSFLRSALKGKSVPILSGPLMGWQWLVSSGIHAYWLGTYEKEYVKVFAQGIKPGQVVFDIGAQAGYFALIASRLTEDQGKVFAFEPLPKNAAFIRQHYLLNNCKNVTLLEKAVGNTPSKRRFKTIGNPSMGNLSHQGDLEVEVVSLDQLVANEKLSPPQVVKIDVEGMDYWVLRGGEKLIREHQPTIFIATHGKTNRARVVQLLEEWGYQVVMVGKGSDKNADYVAYPNKA